MKKVFKTNYRVEVYPRVTTWGDVTDEIRKDTCQEMISDIRRHIDNVNSVEIVHDTEEVCSHCHHDWDVSMDDNDPEYPRGMPLCCDKAINEWTIMGMEKE
jgi:hypothetical protein